MPESTPLTAAERTALKSECAFVSDYALGLVERLLAERDTLAAQVREATGSFANWTEHDRAIENAKLRGQIFDLESQLAAARGIARRLAASLGKEHSTDPDCEDCVALAAFDALHWPEPKGE